MALLLLRYLPFYKSDLPKQALCRFSKMSVKCASFTIVYTVCSHPASPHWVLTSPQAGSEQAGIYSWLFDLLDSSLRR